MGVTFGAGFTGSSSESLSAARAAGFTAAALGVAFGAGLTGSSSESLSTFFGVGLGATFGVTGLAATFGAGSPSESLPGIRGRAAGFGVTLGVTFGAGFTGSSSESLSTFFGVGFGAILGVVGFTTALAFGGSSSDSEVAGSTCRWPAFAPAKLGKAFNMASAAVW